MRDPRRCGASKPEGSAVSSIPPVSSQMTRHTTLHARCKVDRTLPATNARLEVSGLGAGMLGPRLTTSGMKTTSPCPLECNPEILAGASTCWTAASGSAAQTLRTGSVAALANHAVAERRSLEPLSVTLAVLVTNRSEKRGEPTDVSSPQTVQASGRWTTSYSLGTED